MNIHHLELFYYVARHGGISEAVRNMPYGIQRRIDQQGMPSQHLELVNPPVGAEYAEQFHRP